MDRFTAAVSRSAVKSGQTSACMMQSQHDVIDTIADSLNACWALIHIIIWHQPQ